MFATRLLKKSELHWEPFAVSIDKDMLVVQVDKNSNTLLSYERFSKTRGSFLLKI